VLALTAPHGSGSTRYFPGGAADTVDVLLSDFPPAVLLSEPLAALHAVSAASASAPAPMPPSSARAAAEGRGWERGLSRAGSTDLAPSRRLADRDPEKTAWRATAADGHNVYRTRWRGRPIMGLFLALRP
jgi:hypothetical protein